jgi:hypothetical protein
MSIQLLSLLLMMPSAEILTAADLDAALKKVAGASSNLDNKDDSDFVTRPIDWTKLTVDGADEAFRLDLKQNYDHDCLLNAVRFVLQRRHNRMIGTNYQGDRAVLSIIKGKYIKDTAFNSEYIVGNDFSDPKARFPLSLNNGADFLRDVGVNAWAADLTADINSYINFAQAHGGSNGILLVSGDQDHADHTYALFEFQNNGARVEAKIYNPWTGTIVADPTTAQSQWFDVFSFQQNFALPMAFVNERLQKIDANGPVRDDQGNLVYLKPGEPADPSQTVQYAVLFAPL